MITKSMMLCLLIAICSCTSKPAAKAESGSNGMITEKSVDHLYLGMELKDIYKHYSDIRIVKSNHEYYPDRYQIFINSNLAFEVASNDSDQRYISHITIYSDKFEFKNGVKVGTTIKVLKGIYPEMVVYGSGIGEIFYLNDVNPELKGKQYLTGLYLKSTKNKYLGKYENELNTIEDSYQAIEFSEDGYVEKILIYSMG